jgi:type I restriction enzyme M protein
LWFVARDKYGQPRDRRGEVLLVDARGMGQLVDRTHRDLSADEIARISATYHAWRGESKSGEYVDVPGFCRSVRLDELRRYGYVLAPGRYVGSNIPDGQDDDIKERIGDLGATLAVQFQEGRELEQKILTSLRHVE